MMGSDIMSSVFEPKQSKMGGGLEKARQAGDARVAAGLSRYPTPLERLRQRPSPKRAIAAKCWDCQGQDYDPGVKWRIGNCEVGESCPLYGFRPYQSLCGTPTPNALKWMDARVGRDP